MLFTRQCVAWASTLITHKHSRQKKTTEMKETYAQSLTPFWAYFRLELCLRHLLSLLLPSHYVFSLPSLEILLFFRRQYDIHVLSPKRAGAELLVSFAMCSWGAALAFWCHQRRRRLKNKKGSIRRRGWGWGATEWVCAKPSGSVSRYLVVLCVAVGARHSCCVIRLDLPVGGFACM